MDFFSNLPGVSAFDTIYVIAKALFIALDILLVFLFFYALKKSWRFRPHFDLSPEKPHRQRQLVTLTNTYYKDHWKKLLKKYVEKPTPDSIRLALIDADTMLDHVLRDLKFPGENVADRLKALNSNDIKSLDGVWEAHRLRNDVVHHPASAVSVKQGIAALGKYEKLFKEFKIF